MKILLILSRFLSTYTSYFIIAIAVVTFFFPVLFSWVHGDIQSLILGFIMLTMGLTLTLDDMRILAARPWDILIGMVTDRWGRVYWYRDSETCNCRHNPCGMLSWRRIK